MSDENLVRGIGRWSLIAIVINSIVGAGIFALPSKVASIGSYSIAAFLVCAVIIGLIMLCYAEVSSRFSSTGGPYLYAREAFGPVVAFEVGWLSILVRTTSYAAILDIFVINCGYFFASANRPLIRAGIVGIVLLTLTIVNVIGVRQSAAMTNLFTIGKLVPIFAFVAIGLFYIQPENFKFYPLPDHSSFSSTVLILIFAFFGFEMALVPAGEVKDPRKAFPFALLVTLAAVTIIYIVVQIVSIGTLPDLATSERPLSDAANRFIGPAGAALIAAGALISILGNLNVGLLAGSRLLFAMSERREMPAIFSKIHNRSKAPHVAIVFTALLIFVFTIQLSFLTVLLTATVARLLVYATSCLSLIVFRRRGDVPEAQFSVPYGKAIAILSLILILWLITNTDLLKEGLPIIITVSTGLAYFYANRIFRVQAAI